MKYMLLMQFSETTTDIPPISTWSADEVQAHIAFMKAADKKLAESGELVEAQGLAAPDTAKIVRAHGGGPPRITEAPFPDTREFLAGFWIVDCAGPDRAVEIAAFLSTAPGPGGAPLNMPIEVRQTMSAPTQEGDAPR
ncbi:MULTISPECIES: YciI family protein [Streptomyces]|uniref:YciI family protein n=1 Tax=Streptomyces TaxID=1883 RepID=UPI000B9EBC7C|nr:YciI family protein [Streptomyces kasugaensis]